MTFEGVPLMVEHLARYFDTYVAEDHTSKLGLHDVHDHYAEVCSEEGSELYPKLTFSYLLKKYLFEKNNFHRHFLTEDKKKTVFYIRLEKISFFDFKKPWSWMPAGYFLVNKAKDSVVICRNKYHPLFESNPGPVFDIVLRKNGTWDLQFFGMCANLVKERKNTEDYQMSEKGVKQVVDVVDELEVCMKLVSRYDVSQPTFLHVWKRASFEVKNGGIIEIKPYTGHFGLYTTHLHRIEICVKDKKIGLLEIVIHVKSTDEFEEQSKVKIFPFKERKGIGWIKDADNCCSYVPVFEDNKNRQITSESLHNPERSNRQVMLETHNDSECSRQITLEEKNCPESRQVLPKTTNGPESCIEQTIVHILHKAEAVDKQGEKGRRNLKRKYPQIANELEKTKFPVRKPGYDISLKDDHMCSAQTTVSHPDLERILKQRTFQISNEELGKPEPKCSAKRLELGVSLNDDRTCPTQDTVCVPNLKAILKQKILDSNKELGKPKPESSAKRQRHDVPLNDQHTYDQNTACDPNLKAVLKQRTLDSKEEFGKPKPESSAERQRHDVPLNGQHTYDQNTACDPNLKAVLKQRTLDSKEEFGKPKPESSAIRQRHDVPLNDQHTYTQNTKPESSAIRQRHDVPLNDQHTYTQNTKPESSAKRQRHDVPLNDQHTYTQNTACDPNLKAVLKQRTLERLQLKSSDASREIVEHKTSNFAHMSANCDLPEEFVKNTTLRNEVDNIGTNIPVLDALMEVPMVSIKVEPQTEEFGTTYGVTSCSSTIHSTISDSVSPSKISNLTTISTNSSCGSVNTLPDSSCVRSFSSSVSTNMCSRSTSLDTFCSSSPVSTSVGSLSVIKQLLMAKNVPNFSQIIQFPIESEPQKMQTTSAYSTLQKHSEISTSFVLSSVYPVTSTFKSPITCTSPLVKQEFDKMDTEESVQVLGNTLPGSTTLEPFPVNSAFLTSGLINGMTSAIPSVRNSSFTSSPQCVYTSTVTPTPCTVLSKSREVPISTAVPNITVKCEPGLGDNANDIASSKSLHTEKSDYSLPAVWPEVVNEIYDKDGFHVGKSERLPNGNIKLFMSSAYAQAKLNSNESGGRHITSFSNTKSRNSVILPTCFNKQREPDLVVNVNLNEQSLLNTPTRQRERLGTLTHSSNEDANVSKVCASENKKFESWQFSENTSSCSKKCAEFSTVKDLIRNSMLSESSSSENVNTICYPVTLREINTEEYLQSAGILTDIAKPTNLISISDVNTEAIENISTSAMMTNCYNSAITMVTTSIVSNVSANVVSNVSTSMTTKVSAIEYNSVMSNFDENSAQLETCLQTNKSLQPSLVSPKRENDVITNEYNIVLSNSDGNDAHETSTETPESRKPPLVFLKRENVVNTNEYNSVFSYSGETVTQESCLQNTGSRLPSLVSSERENYVTLGEYNNAISNYDSNGVQNNKSRKPPLVSSKRENDVTVDGINNAFVNFDNNDKPETCLQTTDSQQKPLISTKRQNDVEGNVTENEYVFGYSESSTDSCDSTGSPFYYTDDELDIFAESNIHGQHICSIDTVYSLAESESITKSLNSVDRETDGENNHEKDSEKSACPMVSLSLGNNIYETGGGSKKAIEDPDSFKLKASDLCVDNDEFKIDLMNTKFKHDTQMVKVVNTTNKPLAIRVDGTVRGIEPQSTKSFVANTVCPVPLENATLLNETAASQISKAVPTLVQNRRMGSRENDISGSVGCAAEVTDISTFGKAKLCQVIVCPGVNKSEHDNEKTIVQSPLIASGTSQNRHSRRSVETSCSESDFTSMTAEPFSKVSGLPGTIRKEMLRDKMEAVDTRTAIPHNLSPSLQRIAKMSQSKDIKQFQELNTKLQRQIPYDFLKVRVPREIYCDSCLTRPSFVLLDRIDDNRGKFPKVLGCYKECRLKTIRKYKRIPVDVYWA